MKLKAMPFAPDVDSSLPCSLFGRTRWPFMSEHTLLQSIGRRTFLGALLAPTALAFGDWKEFRGDGSSVPGSDERLPQEWSDQTNISWNVATPGYGQSSPVIFDHRVFVTCVEGVRKDTLILSAFALSNGKELWTHRAAPAQAIRDSDMISKAAPTPAADRSGVYAFFETGNLAALDHQGQVRWERRLTDEFGKFGGRHGIGSSLRLCQSGVMALVAHDGPSYLICVDRRTGETVWKTDRRSDVSWTTPALASHDGRELALVSVGNRVEAYDTREGALIWTLGGFERALVASPTPIPGGAIIGSSQKGWTGAIRFGDRSRSIPEIVWRASEASSNFNSPLVHRSRVYMVNRVGVAFCLDLETGQEIWHQRLKGPCWASTIGIGDFIYFFGVDGVVEVFRAADMPVKIAENRLSAQSRLYGVAVENGRLVLRFGRRLACIRQSRPAEQSS
ncbi:MAG: PQQ-binding-like beta-propeller repeat protein [Acidobacteria bacterium]|nr:PQQ-binding-like beta-propeller repeat protein [Acidobacteriota bacterium]